MGHGPPRIVQAKAYWVDNLDSGIDHPHRSSSEKPHDVLL
jgi:hypothetical protein